MSIIQIASEHSENVYHVINRGIIGFTSLNQRERKQLCAYLSGGVFLPHFCTYWSAVLRHRSNEAVPLKSLSSNFGQRRCHPIRGMALFRFRATLGRTSVSGKSVALCTITLNGHNIALAY